MRDNKHSGALLYICTFSFLLPPHGGPVTVGLVYVVALTTMLQGHLSKPPTKSYLSFPVLEECVEMNSQNDTLQVQEMKIPRSSFKRELVGQKEIRFSVSSRCSSVLLEHLMR